MRDTQRFGRPDDYRRPPWMPEPRERCPGFRLPDDGFRQDLALRTAGNAVVSLSPNAAPIGDRLRIVWRCDVLSAPMGLVVLRPRGRLRCCRRPPRRVPTAVTLEFSAEMGARCGEAERIFCGEAAIGFGAYVGLRAETLGVGPVPLLSFVGMAGGGSTVMRARVAPERGGG